MISRRWPLMLLAAYVLLVGVIVFQPIPTVATDTIDDVSAWVQGLGLPGDVATAQRVEFVLNAGMFAPIPLLGALALPRTRWWHWVLVSLLGSVLVEAVQAMLLDLRSAQLVDVLSNTAGGAVGALLGIGLRGWLARRRR